MKTKNKLAPVTGIRITLSLVPFVAALVLWMIKVNVYPRSADGAAHPIQIPMLQLLWVQLCLVLTACLFLWLLWRGRNARVDHAV